MGRRILLFRFFFLVFCQCVCNGLVATAVCMFVKPPPDKTPIMEYFKISFSYIGAMSCSTMALQYVSMPTQVLAKSCKMIPVMLMKIVINGTRYSMIEYVAVGFVTAGISIFMLFSKKGGSDSSSMFGLALLFVSLALDGYTGPAQENIRKNFDPNKYQMMKSMNFVAASLVGAFIFVNGEFFTAIGFIGRHMDVLFPLILYGLSFAFGQIFIMVCLFRFDSLVLTTVTTTRKFFTILASVLWYGHSLVTSQWMGVAVVFAGLGLDAHTKYEKKKARLTSTELKSA